jgi:hypothetical protein
VVSGPQPHAEQLAELANIARYQKDASGFFDLVGTKGKFSKDLRGRLNYVEALVKSAMTDIGIDANEDEIVRHRTWELLSRLTVLMPRLETPDETGWANLANALKPVARGQSLDGASRLRDRLAALAHVSGWQRQRQRPANESARALLARCGKALASQPLLLRNCAAQACVCVVGPRRDRWSLCRFAD